MYFANCYCDVPFQGVAFCVLQTDESVKVLLVEQDDIHANFSFSKTKYLWLFQKTYTHTFGAYIQELQKG